jgi:hypothetical protein
MLPYLVSYFRWEFRKSDELADGYYPKVGVSILLAKPGLSGVRMFQELLKSILDLELIGRRGKTSRSRHLPSEAMRSLERDRTLRAEV